MVLAPPVQYQGREVRVGVAVQQVWCRPPLCCKHQRERLSAEWHWHQSAQPRVDAPPASSMGMKPAGAGMAQEGAMLWRIEVRCDAVILLNRWALRCAAARGYLSCFTALSM